MSSTTDLSLYSCDIAKLFFSAACPEKLFPPVFFENRGSPWGQVTMYLHSFCFYSPRLNVCVANRNIEQI